MINELLIASGGIITTGIALIITIAWDRKKRKDDQEDSRKRAQTSIKNELKNILKDVEDTKIREFKPDEKGWVSFEIIWLASAAFESAVQSGYYILMESKLQNEISDVYLAIKVHNLRTKSFLSFEYSLHSDKEQRNNLFMSERDLYKSELKSLIIRINHLLKKLNE